MVQRAAALVLTAATLIAPATALSQTAGSPLTLIAREGRRQLPVAVINNQDYVAVDDLNQAFGSTAREVAGGLTLAVRNRAIVVTADQSVVSVSGRLVSLNQPPVRRDGKWFVPFDFLPRAMGAALDTRLDLRRTPRLLIVGDLRVPRVVARVEAGSLNASVTFESTPATAARVAAEPGRLTVHFEADALELVLPSLPPQQYLNSLAAGDTAASVRIGTGSRFGAYRVATSQPDAASSRISVELLPGGSTDPLNPPPLPVPNPPPAAAVNPLPATGLRTIVIDPGHGGEALGTQGARGTLEKDVTLAVSRKLKTLIESRLGLRVFLTRDDDRTLELDDRSAFANSQKADVFLSIHANAAVRPSMKGAEVYYLNVERADAEARKRADDAQAALPMLGGGSRTIDFILWETAQVRHLEQSAALAGLIEGALASRVEMSQRAVQQAPFRVLVGANMPSVLVEMGYLSNPEQEAQMAGAAFQDAIAEALFEALVKFRALVERSAP
jgi:N-acetylmuramoyl-L-alanine amidase